jgi:glyoxylase-like metal-dependent hydrolase (beta-lactamase superfamily II)
VKQLCSGVYASTEYPGVTVGFVALPGGAVAIDAPTLPAHARAWRREVTDTAGGPILYLVLTDAHPDRLLSAGEMGAPIVASRKAYEEACRLAEGPWRTAAEHWAHLHPDAAKGLARHSLALPQVLALSSITLRRADEAITVESVAGATPGSVWVHLRNRRILFAGDTVVAEGHPRMENTTDSKAWLNTLKTLRRRAFAKTTIVPGRGAPCTQAATSLLSEYIALVRRRARSIRRAGRSGIGDAVAELVELCPADGDGAEFVEQLARANLERVLREVSSPDS